MTWLMLYCP